MEWAPISFDGAGGLRTMAPEAFLAPIDGAISPLRSLDHFSEGATVALNILYLFALLSLIPTASFLITFFAGWNQRTLATSWLLAEVMDPLGYGFGCLRHSQVVAADQKVRGPVQKARVVAVSILAAFLLVLELIFIIGQTTREGNVDVPLSQFRISIAKKSNVVLDPKRVHRGTANSSYATVDVEVPGVYSNLLLTWSQRNDTNFLGQIGRPKRSLPNRGSAAFRVIVPLKADVESPHFKVFPFLPLDAVVAPLLHTSVGIQGLAASAASFYFAPFTWIDSEAVQMAIDAVAAVTKSQDCDWVVVEQKKPEANVFTVITGKPKCYSTMTAPLQHNICKLLAGILSSRIRVGSFPAEEKGTYDLIDDTAVPITNLLNSGIKAPIKSTSGFKGNKQIIPNAVLITLSCVFVVLALIRALFDGNESKQGGRSFAIVAAAMGWNDSSSFARVAPEASLPPLHSESMDHSGIDSNVSQSVSQDYMTESEFSFYGESQKF